MSQRPRAIVYIDGFNLYRRALSGHPELKWLDLIKLSTNLLPEYEIAKVHYFTSKLKYNAQSDPSRLTRQEIYFRALNTQAPLLQTTLGSFRSDDRWMIRLPLEMDKDAGFYKMVRVRKVEEKGSDVNMAVRMVADAFEGLSDISVVLTNDSDQIGPLNLIKEELGHPFGLIYPVPSSRRSKALQKTNPVFSRFVTEELILKSQFPDVIKDDQGFFHKPERWRNSEGPITGAF
jgi:hypothetical protein